jgi:hypothetical protein
MCQKWADAVCAFWTRSRKGNVATEDNGAKADRYAELSFGQAESIKTRVREDHNLCPEVKEDTTGLEDNNLAGNDGRKWAKEAGEVYEVTSGSWDGTTAAEQRSVAAGKSDLRGAKRRSATTADDGGRAKGRHCPAKLMDCRR